MRCYWGPGRFHFGFGMRPFGFWFGGVRPFPRKQDYIRLLERYKEDLEAELKEVQRELDDLKREEAA